MEISSYYTQHKNVLDLMGELINIISKSDYDPHFVVEKLIKISAQIKYHLSMEDAFIYPKSASSSNADLKALAVKMQEDMVPISAAFGAYVNSWNPDRIGKERAAFVAETKGIAAALKTRIDNEEKNLYPLVANIL